MSDKSNVVDDLEETLRQAHKIDEGFYQELLRDYTVQVMSLKSIDYLWEKIVEIEERRASIEARLPNVTDEEFEDYVVMWDLLGILYEEVKS